MWPLIVPASTVSCMTLVKMWSHGKNSIRKHVFGERCLVFEADVLVAHAAVRYSP
jgi:hypothetical protein